MTLPDTDNKSTLEHTQEPEYSPTMPISTCLDEGMEDDGCFLESTSIREGLLREPDQLESALFREEDKEAGESMEVLSNDFNLKMEVGEECATRDQNTMVVESTKVLENRKTEEEMVDYEKQVCSSSSQKDQQGHPSGPNSFSSDKDQSVTGPENETPIGGDPIDGSDFPIKDRCLRDFDLNKVCSEDIDFTIVTDSVPAIDSAMLPAQGKGMSPPRFEGEREWKGPASTTAFHLASAFKVSEGERTPSTEESSQSARQRRTLNFELNLEAYEDAVDVVANPALGTQVPGSTITGPEDRRPDPFFYEFLTLPEEDRRAALQGRSLKRKIADGWDGYPKYNGCQPPQG